MAKRGIHRRLPGEEPYFPASSGRPYGFPIIETPLPQIDVVAIRRKLGLSQPRFARRFGFPVKTLRQWEQGHRKPRGCALALLHIINGNPQVASNAIMTARAAWLKSPVP